MTDRAVELCLSLARDLGALQLFVLWRELALLAGDRAFTTAEVVAFATKNDGLRLAIEAACGAEFGPRKLGKILARWEAVDVAGLRVDCIGTDPAGILWAIVSTAKPMPERTGAANDASIVALPSI